MTPTAKKIMWVVELLVQERSRTVGDIERTTGFGYRDLHDAVWQLVQEGRICVLPDSRLSVP